MPTAARSSPIANPPPTPAFGSRSGTSRVAPRDHVSPLSSSPTPRNSFTPGSEPTRSRRRPCGSDGSEERLRPAPSRGPIRETSCRRKTSGGRRSPPPRLLGPRCPDEQIFACDLGAGAERPSTVPERRTGSAPPIRLLGEDPVPPRPDRRRRPRSADPSSATAACGPSPRRSRRRPAPGRARRLRAVRLPAERVHGSRVESPSALEASASSPSKPSSIPNWSSGARSGATSLAVWRQVPSSARARRRTPPMPSSALGAPTIIRFPAVAMKAPNRSPMTPSSAVSRAAWLQPWRSPVDEDGARLAVSLGLAEQDLVVADAGGAERLREAESRTPPRRSTPVECSSFLSPWM